MNPGIRVKVEPRPGRHPYLLAHYVTDRRWHVCCRKLSREEVADHVFFLRNSLGNPPAKISRYQETEHPSVQGNWHPWRSRWLRGED